MVRRAAASKLSEFAKVVEPEYLRQDLVALFTNLANDEQDSVRLLAIEAGIAMAGLFRPEDLEQLMMHPLRLATEDKSWRVRYVIADKMVDVSQFSCISIHVVKSVFNIYIYIYIYIYSYKKLWVLK